jgi:hypothetical protein
MNTNLSSLEQIDRLIYLFENETRPQPEEIISFTESYYKSKQNDKCKYCSNKPIKIWKYKTKKIKVCKKCCKRYRDTFYYEL